MASDHIIRRGTHQSRLRMFFMETSYRGGIERHQYGSQYYRSSDGQGNQILDRHNSVYANSPPCSFFTFFLHSKILTVFTRARIWFHLVLGHLSLGEAHFIPLSPLGWAERVSNLVDLPLRLFEYSYSRLVAALILLTRIFQNEGSY